MNTKQSGFNLIEVLLLMAIISILLCAGLFIYPNIVTSSSMKHYLEDIRLNKNEVFKKDGNYFISNQKDVIDTFCLGYKVTAENVFEVRGYQILFTNQKNEKALLNREVCENIEAITGIIIINNKKVKPNSNNNENEPDNTWKSTEKI